MLTIPVQIKPSKIHGLGLFTILPVPKGITVWRYCEPVDYRLKVVPTELRVFADMYAYIPKGKTFFEFPGDAALFMNHSITPNVVCLNEDDMAAGRDIAAGEELTANYYEFDENPESGGRLDR